MMPRRRFVFHRLASKEYRSAMDWYRDRSPSSAERFREAVKRAIDRATTNYTALPAVPSGQRYVRVVGFPYQLVLDTTLREDVVILAVAHTSRRPEYWRYRR